jgi:predicted permease
MRKALDRFRLELRWAGRNLLGRGWRAILVVALLTVALAANALVFATADSLVFNRLPYPGIDRLVIFDVRDPQTGESAGFGAGATALDEWRKQTDLFEGVHTYLSKVIFLQGSGEPELVNAADVTVGLFEILRAEPRWGRRFVDGDERQTPQVVVIAESLARERFGDPARAVNQRLETTAEPLLVVGVMPGTFRFPSGSQRIWRALEPRGPLAANYGLGLMARISDRVPLSDAMAAISTRGDAVAAALGSGPRVVTAKPLAPATPADQQRRMFLLLLAAALCLLLIACANVAGLELASAVSRARTHAIQLAIGAPRAALARVALLEGIALVGTATCTALVIAQQAAEALTRFLPTTMTARAANPIDIDARTVLFMAAVAAVVWLLATAPAVLFAWRTPVAEILRLEGSGTTRSAGGTRLRNALTAAQIAAAVLLLAGSILYVRSYLSLLELEKGFDSTGVVSISLTIPPQLLGTGHDHYLLAERILERVRAVPGVSAAFEGSPPPTTGDSPTLYRQLEIDDRPPVPTDLLFPRLWVTPDYFKALRIPLRAGRMLQADDPPGNVLITEALASRLWPGESAVGRRFRGSADFGWYHVIGVVGHVRTLSDGIEGPSRYFQLYSVRPVPKPPVGPLPARRGWALPSYGFLTITARVDSPARMNDLYDATRSVDTRNILKVESVDDRYAAQFADRLLAARVVSAFGALAFILAIAGLHSLMTFLVADRHREIGVRIAMGADTWHIRRLVLGTSLRLVAVGAAAGVLGIFLTGRWIQSQLHGVAAGDPLTIAAVTTLVAVVAVLATWVPARTATRVDPTTLLR